MKLLGFVGASMSIAVLACAGPAFGFGVINFYYDANVNGQYNPGEHLAGYNTYQYWGTGWQSQLPPMGNMWPWPPGQDFPLSGVATAGDTFFGMSQLYSHAAVKTGHAQNVMFTLSVCTNNVSNTGELVTRTITAAEAQTLNGQYPNNVISVAAPRPHFGWWLVVALDWNETDQAYINQLKTGLKLAARYIFDMTDGHMTLEFIEVRNAAYQYTDAWGRPTCR